MLRLLLTSGGQADAGSQVWSTKIQRVPKFLKQGFFTVKFSNQDAFISIDFKNSTNQQVTLFLQMFRMYVGIIFPHLSHIRASKFKIFFSHGEDILKI